MKQTFAGLLAGLMVAFLFGASSIAFAAPSWTFHASPSLCFFSGTATIDGVNVQVGDIVGAFVDKDSVNDLCIGTYTVNNAGNYGLLNAYGDDGSSPEKDGANTDETVYFKIWDASLNRISYAEPTGNSQWESGGSKTVNLSATSGISADASGNRKDVFASGETIYGRAFLGLQASTSYTLYVVTDKSWSNGDAIPSRIAGSASSFTTDGTGHMPVGTTLYSNPTEGNYDIVIDVNGNGSYNDNVDYLDDSPSVGAQSLPVELSLLTVTVSAEGITIRWRTETEVNNIGFSIYRSEKRDGEYTKIAFIPGAGNSAMPIDYQFTDEAVSTGLTRRKADDNVERDKTYFYYLEDVDVTGERSQSEIIKVAANSEGQIIKVIVPSARPALQIPKRFQLLQNYPNPCNPETWLPYQLTEPAPVIIRIFNPKGQIVRILDLGRQNAGDYVTKGKSAYWDGRNDLGQSVASGVYVYTLQAGKFKAARKMLIVK
jgi:hypothetical protein